MGTQGFKSVGRKVNRMKRKLDRDPKTEVRRTMNAVRHEQRAAIIENDAVATMNLIQAFDSRVTQTTGNRWRYIHENDASYASFVEHGTGPLGDGTYPAPDYSPMLISGLKQWAVAKPGVNITFLDAWAQEAASTISKRGTAPQPFFFPVWEQQKPVLKRRVRYQVKQAVRRT